MNDTIFMTYPGGKNGSGVYQQLINLIPPHHIYIEAFLGGGALMRAKRPAIKNIGIDINPAVIMEWHRNLPSDIPGLELYTSSATQFLYSNHHLSRLDSGAFVYCDPPYLMSTRSSQRQLYEFEYAEIEDHRALINTLRELKCMVMLSGYWSPLYAELLSDWRTHTFQAQTRSGKPATEWVWMNYPEPFELHDYRFLGNNFRQRESIKRQKTRWLNRLQTMPALKRMALLDAIQSMSATSSSPIPGELAESTDIHRQTTSQLTLPDPVHFQ